MSKLLCNGGWEALLAETPPHTDRKSQIPMKLKDVGEFGFIDRIAPYGITRPARVVKGIGDDCAVMEFDGPDYLLVTTDLLVERIHFQLDWGWPELMGAKSLAIQLSDIAACGGRPLDAFISLAVPDRVDVEWLDRFYRGITEYGRAFQVNVLGGDTTSSKSDLIINVAVTGQVPRDQVMFRHTAKPGDALILTGAIGDSAAGCHLLQYSISLPGEIREPLIMAHLAPRAHVKEGRLLASSGSCTAAIDISDGLSSDLGHICDESKLGAVVHADALPRSEPLLEAAARIGSDPLHWMLNGGEDYVLLAAVRPEGLDAVKALLEAEGCSIHVIGMLVEGNDIILKRADGTEAPLPRRGWDHFRQEP